MIFEVSLVLSNAQGGFHKLFFGTSAAIRSGGSAWRCVTSSPVPVWKAGGLGRAWLAELCSAVGQSQGPDPQVGCARASITTFLSQNRGDAVQEVGLPPVPAARYE